MAWTKRSEHVDIVDQTHVIRLHDPERSKDTRHDHIIQIAVGSHCCPHCGRPHAEQSEEHDPKAIHEEVVAHLESIGQRARDYAARHQVPIK